MLEGERNAGFGFDVTNLARNYPGHSMVDAADPSHTFLRKKLATSSETTSNKYGTIVCSTIQYLIVIIFRVCRSNSYVEENEFSKFKKDFSVHPHAAYFGLFQKERLSSGWATTCRAKKTTIVSKVLHSLRRWIK